MIIIKTLWLNLFNFSQTILLIIIKFIFRGNIPGGDVSNGETVFNYLQPFPAKGTGYQRMIFILYQQSNVIDFSQSVSEK